MNNEYLLIFLAALKILHKPTVADEATELFLKNMSKANSHRVKGATLGLVAVLVLILILLGSAFFYITQFIGGDRQVVNATDAGALSAARAILAVAVPQDVVFTEFQGLGVNIPPDKNNGKLAPGAPDPINGKYNVLAYNRAAGVAALVAMNALEEARDGNLLAIDHANTVIAHLQAFGEALNKAIIDSGKLDMDNATTANAFQSIAIENNVNMLGTKSTIGLSADLQFASIPTGTAEDGGKANVYFNKAVFGNDTFLANIANTFQNTSGSIFSISASDPNAIGYEQQSFQGGRPLLKAYVPVSIDRRISPIYLCAVNPASQPHLVDLGRFNSSVSQYGYAPVNALKVQTKTSNTNYKKDLISTLACALVGALYNEYPISMAHGYVRIYNGPDARVANANTLPPMAYGSVNGTNSLFNNELWTGAEGGGGIYATNNNIFFTAHSTRGLAEVQAYIKYNQSKGYDPDGHSAREDPRDGKWVSPAIYNKLKVQYEQENPYRFNPFWPPNADGSLHIGSGPNQLATQQDLLNIRSLLTPVLHPCTTADYGPDPRSVCDNNVAQWQSNLNGQSSLGSPMPLGQTLTDLEALKGEVINQWLDAASANNHKYQYIPDGQLQNDSGSKFYSRDDIGYATPTNASSIAFGTVASPGQLIEQLSKYGPNELFINKINHGTMNLDINDVSQWNDTSTVLGQLLQRCREILPSADWVMVKNLLYAQPIDLGQYAYIYLPPNSNTLAISKNPPAFLNGLSEYLDPAALQADGSNYKVQDQALVAQGLSDPPLGTIVNSAKYDGNNLLGDNHLHAQPFESFEGMVNTYDYINWQPSSGINGLLGELSFYNSVQANGKFSAPN